ncbi:MAG: M56 family metallopeptidase [Oscillospiraceae bacterium]|nr:M56 family metallopeptidase [Oscillospiraceae bacterium]
MVNLLYNLLMMSISGTIMFLVSLLFTGHKRYAWVRYAMLTAAVLLMLIPVQSLIRVPKAVNVSVPEQVFISSGYAVAPVRNRMVISVAIILVLVWIIGAAINAIRFIFRYRKSSRILKRISEKCTDEKLHKSLSDCCRQLGIKRRIRLRKSRFLNSPMLFGIIKPSVIIPDSEFTEQQLQMVMMHELTHYKHCDLWISLIASAAQCIHWFNPAVYFIGSSIVTARELCCDESVLERLEPEVKKDYGRLILSVIESGFNSGLAYTTSMASTKTNLQKRLKKIVEFRPRSKAFKLACLMLVGSCVVSSLTALGFEKAAEIIPEEIKEELERPIDIEDIVSIVSDAEDKAASEPAAVEQSYKTETSEPAVVYQAPVVTAEPEQTEYAPAVSSEPRSISLPEASYVFKPDFSENEAVQSDYIYAPEGTMITVQKYTQDGSDLSIEVIDAATGESIIDSGNDRERFSFMRSGDNTYYIVAHCTTGDVDGIYVQGRNTND